MLLFPTAQTPSSILAQIPSAKHHYLIFFSSPEERGRPWCRDCQNAEPILAKNIRDSESTLVYVGSRDEWNDPKNPWRQSPFNVERVPTIIKIPAPTEASTLSVTDRVASAPRLAEAEILEGSLFRPFIAAGELPKTA